MKLLYRMRACFIVLMAVLFCGSGFASTYSTSFPLTENPISESGNWTVPSENGDSSLWSNVETGSAHAYGQAMPTTFGDPSASLTGTWGPSQTVTGTVFINGSLTGVHEDELRLRQTIGSSSITGYELNVSLDPGNPYANIVRWNGANGHFCTGAANTTTHAVNGDVIKGTITGTNPTVITMYLNGNQLLQWSDNGAGPSDCGSEANYGPWETGAPGIGFYNGGSDWSSFGFSNFTATDGSGSGTSILPKPTLYEVALTWSESSPNDPVVGFNVYRQQLGTTGQYVQINSAQVVPTNFADLQLSSNVSYSYYVTALDAQDNESGASNIYTVSIPFFPYPVTIGPLRAT